MRITPLFILAALPGMASASSKPNLRPAQLQQQIQDKGAKHVAATLFVNKSSWATLTKNVCSGKSDWIDVAIRLRSGTDGGASSELQDALFVALGTNPRYVLRISAPTVPIHVLCSGRSDPLPTAKAALSEIERIHKSVAAVHDKDLVEQQKECLTALQQDTTNTKRFFQN